MITLDLLSFEAADLGPEMQLVGGAGSKLKPPWPEHQAQNHHSCGCGHHVLFSQYIGMWQQVVEARLETIPELPMALGATS